MRFDAFSHVELRSHHAQCGYPFPYDAWLTSLVATFEGQFPKLPISMRPNIFLVWVRANTAAICAVPKPTDVLH